MNHRDRCRCCEHGTLSTQYDDEYVEVDIRSGKILRDEPYDLDGPGKFIRALNVPYAMCDLCGTRFVTSETLKAREKAADDHQAKVKEAKELFRKNLSRST